MRFVPGILRLVADLRDSVPAFRKSLRQLFFVLLTLLPQLCERRSLMLPHLKILPVLLCLLQKRGLQILAIGLLQDLVEGHLDLVINIRVLQRQLGAVYR